tara:strand:- start:124 stop:618 length:495 start_codon:yes stop_codon:yes gene_type:complete
MRYFKSIACSFFLSLYLGIFVGCSAFDRYDKNSQGYYEEHFRSCGPKALEKAFGKLNEEITRKEISQVIQDKPRPLIKLLSFFNKDSVEITWPNDIKRVAKKYGYKVISIKEFNKLDPEKDVAIILINTTLRNCHWLCFPVDKNISEYWGENTKISKIYILRKI